MAVSEKELENQLVQAGKRLLSPPSSVGELLPLLEELERCLERVEQSPSKRMQDALSPSIKALVANKLLGHLDPDVKVSVATCISEIIRITAPDAPYDDDQMKEIFQLTVSSFEKLYDKSSRSYKKRASIVETVAKVRSCLLMLDLECDVLILEMFQHFLKSVRDYHLEDIFSYMETIMTLVLEESEDMSPELLSSILQYLKRDNKVVQPIAQKLAEKVLTNCATKVKPYLLQAIKSFGTSLNDYEGVVANVCQASPGAMESNNINVGGNNLEAKAIPKEGASPTKVSPTTDSTTDKLKPNTSNGDLQKEAELSRGCEGSRGEENDDIEAKAAEESSKATSPDYAELIAKIQPKGKNNRKRGRKGYPSKSTLGVAEVAPIEEDTKAEKVTDHQERESKAIGSSRHNDTAVDTNVPSDGDKKTEVQHPPPKTSENEAMDISFPSPSGHLPEESRSKEVGRGNKKENTIQENTPEHVVAAKKEDESSGDLVTKSTKQLSQKADSVSSQWDDKRRRRQKKAVLGEDLMKISSKDEAKACDSPPKSAVKSVKNETPAVSSKRKRTAGRKKASETEEYGDNVVGAKIKVWWPDDQMFYEGFVDSFDHFKGKHKIVYTDGDEEVLNLKREEWEFVKGDADTDKGNPNDYGNLHASPKKAGGGASSGKAKATAPKRGCKKKVESNADKKSEDDSSKNAVRAEDEKVAKSKEGDIVTPLASTKSKQQTSNNSTKGKTTKRHRSKSNANGNVKVKAGSSSKDTKMAKKPSPESAKSGETGKDKSPSTSKAQKIETKSGKKRQRRS